MDTIKTIPIYNDHTWCNAALFHKVLIDNVHVALHTTPSPPINERPAASGDAPSDSRIHNCVHLRLRNAANIGQIPLGASLLHAQHVL